MAKIYDFENIEPKEVLKWFKKICSIPHGSFKEKTLAQMLKFELEQAGCKVQVLSSGALFIQQKATFDNHDWPTVLLQGHMDMVQVANPGVEINFDKDPISAYYDTEKGWLKADGTTLGADNGVALGMFMEVLTNPNIEHGPLEALFTVGEEVDTTVCMSSIPNNLITAQYYINLDSDHDNTIYYASAGVYKVSFDLPLSYKPTNANTSTYEIKLENFQGGHSALVIHNVHINPIVFLCKTLLNYNNLKNPISLVKLDGGTAMNSIPTWVKAVVQVSDEDENKFREYLKENLDIAKIAAQGYEDDATLVVNKINSAKEALDVKDSNHIFSYFSFAPNDMFMVSQDSGCMFNSSNIGYVKTQNGKIISAFLPRSFYKPDLVNIANSLAIYAKNNGAENIEVKDSCACWLTPNYQKSRIINLWKENYMNVVGSEPLIRPNPGGLEVAEIIPKNEKMLKNAMSTGPIIFKEHSTFENCPVESIKKIWKILQLTLKGLNK